MAEVTDRLAEIAQLADKAHVAVARMAKEGKPPRMTIPARPDVDEDLVIGQLCRETKWLLSEVSRLQRQKDEQIADKHRILREYEEQAVKLRAEVSRLQQASRTREDYDLRCDGCGAPHWLDTSIPSDIWNQIAPTGGMLCLLCIDERCEALGLTTDAEFYFVGKAVTSKLYAAGLGEMQRLQQENTALLAALFVFGIEPPENPGEEWIRITDDGGEPAGETAVAAANEAHRALWGALEKAESELSALRSAPSTEKGWLDKHLADPANRAAFDAEYRRIAAEEGSAPPSGIPTVTEKMIDAVVGAVQMSELPGHGPGESAIVNFHCMCDRCEAVLHLAISAAFDARVDALAPRTPPPICDKETCDCGGTCEHFRAQFGPQEDK